MRKILPLFLAVMLGLPLVSQADDQAPVGSTILGPDYTTPGRWRVQLGSTVPLGNGDTVRIEHDGQPLGEGRVEYTQPGVAIISTSGPLSSPPSIGDVVVFVRHKAVAVASPEPSLAAGSSYLLNIAFGTHFQQALEGVSLKKGPAAVGNGPNDTWNLYSRDDPQGEWRTDGQLNAVKTSGGLPTSVSLSVQNARGAWNNSALDPMFASYLYPLGNQGNVTVTVNNLSAGAYDVYLYSHDSGFQLKSGATVSALKTTYAPNVAKKTVAWKEGSTYVVFRHVTVAAGSPIVITVLPNKTDASVQSGLAEATVPALIAGMQITRCPEK